MKWWSRIDSPFRLYGVRGIVVGLTSLADGICTLLSLGMWYPNWWIVVMGWELDWSRNRREKNEAR